MEALRITPRLVLIGLTAHLALRLSFILPVGFGQADKHETALDAIRITGALAAYGLALLICRRLADEYREAKWMRLAWLALTVNAALSFIRPLVRSPLPLPGQEIDLYSAPPIYGLLHHLALTPANLFLLLGLLAMWWAYREAGLGFKFQRRDGAALGGLFLLMLVFFYYKDLLTEAQALYRATSILQLVAQVQLFLIAAAGLLLHRISVQMGNGRLAVVLRWLTLYALARLALVLSVSLLRAAWPQHERLITDVADFGWQAAPWLFSLAVVHQAELTALAAERLAHIKQQRAAKRTVPV
ncbi:MAG TPA: hypothetical protein PLD20_31295 [Blastocatellia bacterium]|nr:hypothetical protein [Blastocatellia bacterium]HMV85887.1 hypothetical protein [Blastocatellia bacterium]HMX27788.1 hypothetical protein [Blastocatellia bacterium]HMY73203.1 hypothetical protein [Blastocatellia bacterium]HMZ22458.1 hypothetical protein [Blastocatellia bacterium]